MWAFGTSGIKTLLCADPMQVCALQWSRHEKEILSSHGFSQNQLCLWKYPSMAKVRTDEPTLALETNT